MRTTPGLPIRLPVFLFPSCRTSEQEPHCSRRLPAFLYFRRAVPWSRSCTAALDSRQGAVLDLVVDRWLVCCRRFLLHWQLWQHSTGTSGSPSSIAAGEQEGRMIQGVERIRGAEFILCIVGPYFFIFGKFKWGILGDSIFFLSHIYLGTCQTMRFGKKK